MDAAPDKLDNPAGMFNGGQRLVGLQPTPMTEATFRALRSARFPFVA